MLHYHYVGGFYRYKLSWNERQISNIMHAVIFFLIISPIFRPGVITVSLIVIKN